MDNGDSKERKFVGLQIHEEIRIRSSKEKGAEIARQAFVVGVLGDFGGTSATSAKKGGQRFKNIDRDNFDDVLKSMKPRLAMRVDNTLKEDGSELAVELNFEKLADFLPDSVVRQVKPLSDLQDVRNQLKDLLGRMEGNDRLEELLGAITDNEGVRDKLKEVLGAGAPSSEGGDGGGDAGGQEG